MPLGIEDCVGSVVASASGPEGEAGPPGIYTRAWQNSVTHYDNLPNALFTLWHIFALDGWWSVTEQPPPPR